MSRDLNDRLVDGTLPADPKIRALPVNPAAKAKDDAEPMHVYSVQELLNESHERARQPRATKGVCVTGHYLLDEYTAGMRPGFTWVLAADTSVGKSSKVIAMADESIKIGRRPLIVSAEDAPSIYADRLMARRARVSADRLRKRRCHPEELARMAETAQKAEPVPVYVDAGNRPIERLEKELRHIIRAEAIDVVFFDYLQEFQSQRKHQDERLKFKHIAKVMRYLIKSENKTGVIVSQLTMTNDTKIPNKHNIRDCRDVGNGAEVIVILFKPDADVQGPSPGRDEQNRPLAPEVLFRQGVRYALLDKNKDGPAGKRVQLEWNEESACFDTVKDPEIERYERMAEEGGYG
jgi:replicative DNA helicase